MSPPPPFPAAIAVPPLSQVATAGFPLPPSVRPVATGTFPLPPFPAAIAVPSPIRVAMAGFPAPPSVRPVATGPFPIPPSGSGGRTPASALSSTPSLRSTPTSVRGSITILGLVLGEVAGA